MQKQEYLRPHDVSVLLQFVIEPRTTFRMLANRVGLSLGETHNAAKRLELARLVVLEEESINVSAAIDFISCGVPYAFPAQLGSPARGIVTAFSASPLAGEFDSDQVIVWPHPHGDRRGTSLIPLSSAIAKIWAHNRELYQLLALVDAVRVGRVRERKVARRYLETELEAYGARWTD